MRRSKWKGPFLDYSLFQLIQISKTIKTESRNSTILPCMIGRNFLVYNGKKHIPLRVEQNMLGFKLGSFVMSRLRHVYKKERIKSKKKFK